MSRLGVCVVALVTTVSVARADPPAIEIGGTMGVHIFNGRGSLGIVPEDEGEGQKTSAFFGVRAGIFFARHYGVEVEGGVIPTEPNSTVFDVFDYAIRAHLAYQFDPILPKLSPFLVAGGGLMDLFSTRNEVILKKDHNFQPYVGAGLKLATNGGWGVRLDIRFIFPPAKQDQDVTLDFEGLLSLTRTFGGHHEVKKPPAAPPVVKEDPDPDHDGILGSADKCPNEPEDKDGFQDEDGCPDPDNDNDGIPDAQDKCPNEPEDKDGFQDADGCPDPDNDGDGIPDAQDKCPNEPETKNGYQDADGCPDEIPEKVKQFTGVIQGINFKLGDAALAPTSTPVLDKAIAVMAEFKDVKLEIQGHTDDLQIKSKKYPDNTALSQARAESVKAYFVKKGIDESRLIAKGYGDAQPIDDPKGLKGAKLNAARAKNRRVEFKLVMPAAPPAPATTPAPAATPASAAPAATPATAPATAPAPASASPTPAAPSAPTPAPTK